MGIYLNFKGITPEQHKYLQKQVEAIVINSHQKINQLLKEQEKNMTADNHNNSLKIITADILEKFNNLVQHHNETSMHTEEPNNEGIKKLEEKMSKILSFNRSFSQFLQSKDILEITEKIKLFDVKNDGDHQALIELGLLLAEKCEKYNLQMQKKEDNSSNISETSDEESNIVYAEILKLIDSIEQKMDKKFLVEFEKLDRKLYNNINQTLNKSPHIEKYLIDYFNKEEIIFHDCDDAYVDFFKKFDDFVNEILEKKSTSALLSKDDYNNVVSYIQSGLIKHRKNDKSLIKKSKNELHNIIAFANQDDQLDLIKIENFYLDYFKSINKMVKKEQKKFDNKLNNLVKESLEKI